MCKRFFYFFYEKLKISSICSVEYKKEDMPNMPPAGQLKDYVNVVGDEAPVFTRVVR